MNEDLHQRLTRLHLKGMDQALDSELERAQREGTAHFELIRRLLMEEMCFREERGLQYRLQQAKIPWPWTLQTFPFDRKPDLNRSQIQTLAGLSFVEHAQNIVFIGEPGTGKTGLAIGLLRHAILSGYRCRFFNAQELLDQLYASLADRTTPGLMKTLSNHDVLLIDELGYLTLKSEQINAFFRLMELRYQKKSTLITTNLDYPDWYGLFQRKSLTDAMIDRLRHHCITIRLNGPSLRAPIEDLPKPLS
jgi:DNA replication protein DnaC